MAAVEQYQEEVEEVSQSYRVCSVQQIIFLNSFLSMDAVLKFFYSRTRTGG